VVALAGTVPAEAVSWTVTPDNALPPASVTRPLIWLGPPSGIVDGEAWSVPPVGVPSVTRTPA